MNGEVISNLDQLETALDAMAVTLRQVVCTANDISAMPQPPPDAGICNEIEFFFRTYNRLQKGIDIVRAKQAMITHRIPTKVVAFPCAALSYCEAVVDFVSGTKPALYNHRTDIDLSLQWKNVWWFNYSWESRVKNALKQPHLNDSDDFIDRMVACYKSELTEAVSKFAKPGLAQGWPTLTPQKLRWVFDLSQDTIAKMLKNQVIPNVRINSKLYRVDPAILPANWESIVNSTASLQSR